MLTEEQGMIRDVVREFAAGELAPLAAAIDAEAQFPRPAWAKLAALDLLNLTVPVDAGGAGAGDVAFAVAVEELARACGSTAAAVVVHTALAVRPIAVAGDAAQRRRWLAPLTGGSRFATLVVADATAVAAAVTAVRRDAGWTLSGNCDAVPGAAHADTFVVAAQLESPVEIGLFVIERDAPGLAIEAGSTGLGLRGLGRGRIELRDVACGDDARLGDTDAARAALAGAFESAWVGMAAVATGIAQGAFERALRYARERPQFDRLIIRHESVQWHLADSALDTHAARATTFAAARAQDGATAAGAGVRRLAAMAKLVATDAAVRVCDRAIQIHGGYGYMTEFHVERAYRDAQACQLACGSNDDLRRIVVHELEREADAGWTLLQ